MSNGPEKSMGQLWVALMNALASAHRLAPAAVIMLLLLGLVLFAFAAISDATLVASVVALVVTMSSVAYAATRNFAESSLTLVAGLFAAYGISWTTGSFGGLVLGLAVFSGTAVLISSIRLAASTEQALRHASLLYSPGDHRPVEAELKKASAPTPLGALHPEERANAVLELAIKNHPLAHVRTALEHIEQLKLVTNLPTRTVADFYGELYRLQLRSGSQRLPVDDIVDMLRQAPAPADEYVTCVRVMRRVAVEKDLDAISLMRGVTTAIEDGYGADNIANYFSARSA